ncbi:argininosuccinate lyase [Alsobacter sp. SYSU M60028]|uniref:Argininosuccinate lyase n=1 Tax=Alsobacter ponti TaxID=2962936 RepID=A0ABT1LEV0_9HYPH|nr:argininosuccinate lyase [Alsobacter ponti]MCP8939979.1 argininosuccinate lyase [Alsobacter ponti]
MSETVSLRERVKSPPAQALVDAYYAPAVANGIRFQFEPEMRIHLAHALMLADRGIVDRQQIARILDVLLALLEAGPATLAIDYKQEDLYSYVERHIVQALGPDTGGRLHTARSRNDLHVTSWRLALRGRLLKVLDALLALRATVLRLADDHRETVMPGYTHTQHAQPISLGYYLLAYGDLLARDFKRLRGALERCDRSPLGSGALTTTGFPIDRQAVADRLGFAGLLEVAYDGVSCRDDVHEAAAANAVMMTGLSRLATDLQAWNTMEYGFIEMDDSFSSVSSIMPQKKNPQAMEFLKAAAGHVTGALATVLACSKNTHFSDVNDGVSSINVPALEALDRSAAALAVAKGALDTMSVRRDTMLHAAAIGFGTATELADVVVRETGLSFRMAHNIVGRVVRETIEAGKTALDITSQDLDAAANALFGRTLGIDPQIVRQALDPAENLKLRTVTGGPAPDTVADMLARRREALAADEGDVASVRAHIAAADAALLAEARAARASSKGG